jgi:hypothetical protein
LSTAEPGSVFLAISPRRIHARRLAGADAIVFLGGSVVCQLAFLGCRGHGDVLVFARTVVFDSCLSVEGGKSVSM